MFGIGLPEMILIMALALIVVGPDKLPELARSVAKGVLELKKTVSALKEDIVEENPFDAVKPELEEAAESIKKQLGDATPDGFTGIVKDLEEGLQEVIEKDGSVLPVSTDDIIKTVVGDSGADQSEKESSDLNPEEGGEIADEPTSTAAGDSGSQPPDTPEEPRPPSSSA